jgi:hypothetical protein
MQVYLTGRMLHKVEASTGITRIQMRSYNFTHAYYELERLEMISSVSVPSVCEDYVVLHNSFT